MVKYSCQERKRKCSKTLEAAETYTHTHTHTDSFLKSLKQIGTICLTISLFTIPNFASAENIPTTNPGCTTTVLGAQNIANGSAALEPDFSANTINTTWYSNGTQLTGNNIPVTCTYDAALTPPTPDARPGYEFNGWKIRVPQCNIPSTDVSNAPNAYAAKPLNGGSAITYGGATAATYGISDPGEWGVSWENGDKAIGEALCSQTGGGTPDTSGAGTMTYCWCRATGYMPNGGEQCSFVSASWVLYVTNRISVSYCARNCSSYCINAVRTKADFRAAMFTGLVAQ